MKTLNDFVISKTEKKVEYSNNKVLVFLIENPDKKLAQEIRDFRVDETKVLDGIWDKDPWNVVEWEEVEVRLEKKRDVRYVDRKKLEEKFKAQLSTDIIAKYPVDEHFKKLFDNLYYVFPLEISYQQSRISTIEFGKKIIQRYFSVYNQPGSKNANLSIGEDNFRTDMKFLPDGNIQFTDQAYHHSLLNYQFGKISKMHLVERFKELVLEIGEVEYNPEDLRFYTPEFMYVLEMGSPQYHSFGTFEVKFHGIKHHLKNKYKESPKHMTYVKPKEVETISAQRMLDLIMEEIPKEFLAKFE